MPHLSFLYPAGSPGSPRDVLVTKSASELTLQWTEGHSGDTPTTGYVIEARPSGRVAGPTNGVAVQLTAMLLRLWLGLPSLSLSAFSPNKAETNRAVLLKDDVHGSLNSPQFSQSQLCRSP